VQSTVRLEAMRRKLSTTGLTDGSVGVITRILSSEHVAKQGAKSSAPDELMGTGATHRFNKWLLHQQQNVSEDSTATFELRVIG
jgi:hypothetical protein